jgi:hypothetical protein
VKQFLPELFVFVAVPGVPAHNTPFGAQCSSSGHRTQNQWRHTQSQRFTDASGTCQPLWHLDGSRSQSFPSVSCSLNLHIFLGLSLNSYRFFALLTNYTHRCHTP